MPRSLYCLVVWIECYLYLFLCVVDAPAQKARPCRVEPRPGERKCWLKDGWLGSDGETQDEEQVPYHQTPTVPQARASHSPSPFCLRLQFHG